MPTARSIAADLSSLPNPTAGLRKVSPPGDLHVLASPVPGADRIFNADRLMIAPEAVPTLRVCEFGWGNAWSKFVPT